MNAKYPLLTTVSTLAVGLIAVTALPFILLFATGPSADQRAETLLTSNEAAWEDRGNTVAALHAANPEFDLMWRTFTVLAACDRAIAYPEEADRWLALADAMIRDTHAVATTRGQRHFLLGYADRQDWRQPDAGSLFVDGEIALMVNARRLVKDAPWLADLGQVWTAKVERDFALAGERLPESYPNEAWAFCITNALLALHMSDVVDGTDHSAFIHTTTTHMATDLTDPATGLLGSDWEVDGTPLDGTEGSSLWWVSTGLLVLNPELATRQYQGAHDSLIGGLPGMAWSREWPGEAHPSDIDSGPIIPFFEASPASSGFALIAASAHGDTRTRRKFVRAIRAADVLLRVDPRLSQMAEAPMGDAIITFGLGFGPLWARI